MGNIMRVCILLTTLVACTFGSLSPTELQAGFAQWEKENIPEVSLFSGQKETHFAAYCAAANFVEEHNKLGSDWEAGINAFSGLTEAEKATHLGLNASTVLEERSRSLVKRSLLTVTNVEKRGDSVDYSKKLPGVKNQGRCGSCWTFGATVALEYQVNRVRSNVINLAEQQYLDCVYEGSRDGCNGGWPTKCYEWTQNNGNMIAKTADYPYVAKDEKCRTDVPNGIKGYKVSGSRFLQKGDDNMLAAVKDKSIGVISVAIGVINSFFSYKSGVYSSTCCDRINHAVAVVGYGTLNGVDYFRVRNSWGSGWGDAGHIKMKRGPNTCALSSYGHYPLVSGGGDDDDDEGGCKYVAKEKTKLKKVLEKGLTKAKAMAECDSNKKCVGITCKSDKNCVVNGSSKSKAHKKFTAYLKKCD